MSIKTLTANILSKMSGVSKTQQKFMIHLMWLLVAMRGRVNFMNMSRQGSYNESSYRNNFDKPFDFLSFNQALVKQYCESEVIIAFDPSYISKSGKHTPGVGYFWSGSAGRSKWGLEIGGFGAVDINKNTCLHLVAKQTLEHQSAGSLLDYYASQVVSMASELQKTSRFLVVDAFFSKRPFVGVVVEAGFEVISRLRDDAVLFYPYLGPTSAGRGRPRVYAGKVDLKHLDPQHFKAIIQEPDMTAYEAKVYSKALKRWIKLVVVHYMDADGKIKAAKAYFSSNCTTPGTDIYVYYKARFQIEFLYRDAKQFTGLEQCQSRKKERLHFHFNASLTAVSVAKAACHKQPKTGQRKSFSMYNIKTQYFNELMLDRFFCVFANIPKPPKNNPAYLKLRDFGKIAA